MLFEPTQISLLVVMIELAELYLDCCPIGCNQLIIERCLMGFLPFEGLYPCFE
jgi:hypothetical protein